ncbi:TPA: hypothetical protein ACS61W_001718 [Klebsiella oxytoca]
MSNLPETPSWESGIHQLEEAERAKAGPGGVLNVQATQLANRTLYLKEAVDDLSEAVYSGSDIYETKEEGLLKTSEGEYFKVPVSGISDISYILYQNKSGVAVEILREKSPYSSGYQAATVVSSGAANTVAITIPGLLGDGSLIYFLSPILNTGAVNIKVTDAKGNSVTRIVLRRANAALSGGELIASNPVLMEYRGAPVDNFMLVASGPTASEIASNLDAYKATNDALTATLKNQVPVPVTVSAVADDIYTATSAITSGELQNGRPFLFTPPSSNTSRAPKLKLNALGAYAITRIDGGQVAAGDLASGRAHLMHWHAGSNQFRVMTYADERTKIYGTVLRATMTSDASTPNDLACTVDGYINDGTLINLEPPATNTGAVVITATDRYGNQIVRSLLKGANSALSGGELQYAKPAQIMYRGSPQNNFKIITSGDLTTDVKNLQSDVDTLKASFTNPYTNLAKKLTGDGTTGGTGPFGSISYKAGVKTVAKRRIILTTAGSSVGKGAGSSGPQFAPSALLISAIKSHLDGYGEFEFIDDNQSIPTQAVQQFSAQLQNSPYFTSTDPNDWPDIVLIVGGMNDAPLGNFNNGLTYPGQRTKLKSLIAECKAKGAIVIVATSPHHNVESANVINTSLGSLNVNWPIRTFNVPYSFTFDAVAKTISSSSFAYDTGNAATSFGGSILRSGHILRVLSGDNAGDYTIATISEDRQTITVEEAIPVSGALSTTIRHINLDSMQEEILYPAPSKSFIETDWSGSGIKTVGAARFGMVNNMYREVAREDSVFVMECEIPWFRLGVEVHGWSALFNSPNYNHPNDLGYTVSYKAGADAAAFSLCKLIYGEKYYLPS